MTTATDAPAHAKDDIKRAAAAGSKVPMTTPIALPDELLPVVPLPIDALPEAFRAYVADVAEIMNCPPDFIAVPMLVAAASLIARHVGIRPQAHTSWTEPCNLWALIAGRPGVMKTPALTRALEFLNRLEAKAATEHREARDKFDNGAVVRKLREEARAKNVREALKKNPNADVSSLLSSDASDEPSRKRYIVADATYEKLGELFVENPGGLLSVRDEMRGLFLHLAREESATARAFYLSAWSGGTYHFDRIARGTVTIKDVRLSMIGGIQPGPLFDLMRQARKGAADDGMIERFLTVMPDSAGPWKDIDRVPDSEAKRLVWTTFDRLDSLIADTVGALIEVGIDGNPEGLPYLRFAEDALPLFVEWRGELEAKLRTEEDESLEGALSKFRHHVPALALALHVIDGGTGPVSRVATMRALALAEYFESHTRRVYAGARRSAVTGAKVILKKIADGSLPVLFTARDVSRPQWSGLREKAAVDEAIEMLVDHLWLDEHHDEQKPEGGRRTTRYSRSEGACRHG